MAQDLFHSMSPNELKREIAKLTVGDNRSLPDKAKVFSAIANIQKFDQLPDMTDFNGLNALIQKGDIELNRGITSTKGVPATIYVKDLLFGAMYPGTLSSLGNGIYLATTQSSIPDNISLPETFPTISRIAMKYASNDEPGIIIRCALKNDAKKLDFEDLKDFSRQNRNRAREAGVTDFGAIAAALGFDAYVREHIEEKIDEKVWVVVNRNALTFQKEALQYAPASVK